MLKLLKVNRSPLSEPLWAKIMLTTIALGFVALFIVAPIATVFLKHLEAV